jgi:hypothetical protein
MAKTQDEKIEIEVVRGFLWDGLPRPRGTRLVVPFDFGLKQIANGKARRPRAAMAAPSPPETAQAPEARTTEPRGRRRAGQPAAEEG